MTALLPTIEVVLPARALELRLAMRIVKREGKNVTAIFSEQTWKTICEQRDRRP